MTAARRGTLRAMDDRDDVELHIVKVPMLDTGIGRSMGYADDAEFVAAAAAEREAALRLLTPEAREKLEAAELAAELAADRAFIGL